MSSIDQILAQQRALHNERPTENKSYELFLQTVDQLPDVLLIGCIDARLPLAALGPPHGKEIIHRVPAAFVDQNSSSFATTLALAIERKKIKDIVVMGHTDCAAIKEFDAQKPDMPEIAQHFAKLDDVRKKLCSSDLSANDRCQKLEEAAVCQSLNSLMAYPRVAEAVAKGEVKLHGWVLDVHKAREGKPFINELISLESGKFQPMWQAGIDLKREGRIPGK